ncbi:hypothetical protein FJTKL_01201 [Diaporthe vaccinii]|uniref:Cytochrome P450 n=1 Tax=Diaporthe vaccinii TaxID=105482 RepID=A0ABR4F5F4_9PEZI
MHQIPSHVASGTGTRKRGAEPCRRGPAIALVHRLRPAAVHPGDRQRNHAPPAHRAVSPPHYTTADVIYNDYLIPKGSVISIGTYAIHYDEKLHADPEAFFPERYLGHPLTAGEYAAAPDPYDRDHFTFGAGRRICAGLYVAENSMFIMLAKLLWAFRIRPCVGPDGKEEILDISDEGYVADSALTVSKPYRVQFTPGNVLRERTLVEEWRAAEREGYNVGISGGGSEGGRPRLWGKGSTAVETSGVTAARTTPHLDPSCLPRQMSLPHLDGSSRRYDVDGRWNNQPSQAKQARSQGSQGSQVQVARCDDGDTISRGWVNYVGTGRYISPDEAKPIPPPHQPTASAPVTHLPPTFKPPPQSHQSSAS